MNKVAIRKFAVQARVHLIESITKRVNDLGVTESDVKERKPFDGRYEMKQHLFNRVERKQRDALLKKMIQQGYCEVIEEVAYTWFKYLIAIRYMEVNRYLPTNVRVFSSQQEGKREPDLLTQAHSVELEVDRDYIDQLLETKQTGKLYNYLLIQQCNALSSLLPHLFEKVTDVAELLLPENLLEDGSVIQLLISTIPEEEWKGQVEIIGWLYQYYIADKKDQVFADLKKNKKILKENIPAATQLFTPKWIVQYMVENSVGRLWGKAQQNFSVKKEWKYYVEEVKQEEKVQQQLDLLINQTFQLENVKVIDPSMGSGHILVYVFDMLYQMYRKVNYSPDTIPKLIIENNLYGLDIDDRVAQLAYFAIMMKGRSYDPQFFEKTIYHNLMAIQVSDQLKIEDVEIFLPHDAQLRDDILYLMELFKNAKEFGSILLVKSVQIKAIEQWLSELQNQALTEPLK